MLPKKLIVFDSKDKEDHEKWDQERKRDIMSFPCPFRAILMGPPSCGKSSFTKNIILHAKPAFERIILVHYLNGITEEYDGLGVEEMDELPTQDDISMNPVKTLVILEDLTLNKNDENLNRLFGVISTHMNTSVICTTQDCFQLPTIIRRCSNIWTIWKTNDLNSLNQIASRVGLKPHNFNTIFNMFDSPHDNLTIDLTNNTPAKYRINGFNIINKKNN